MTEHTPVLVGISQAPQRVDDPAEAPPPRCEREFRGRGVRIDGAGGAVRQ